MPDEVRGEAATPAYFYLWRSLDVFRELVGSN